MEAFWRRVLIRGAGFLLAALAAPFLPLPAQGEVREGAAAYVVLGHGEVDWFGRQLAVLGDVDGDGVKDFVASGEALNFGPKTGAGHVDLLSGRTGALLRRWFGRREYEYLGTLLGALPDIDGDGVFELGATDNLGELTAFSPTSGEPWYEIPHHDDPLGFALGAFLRLPDEDGDGVEEFIYVDAFARTDYGTDPPWTAAWS